MLQKMSDKGRLSPGVGETSAAACSPRRPLTVSLQQEAPPPRKCIAQPRAGTRGRTNKQTRVGGRTNKQTNTHTPVGVRRHLPPGPGNHKAGWGHRWMVPTRLGLYPRPVELSFIYCVRQVKGTAGEVCPCSFPSAFPSLCAARGPRRPPRPMKQTEPHRASHLGHRIGGEKLSVLLSRHEEAQGDPPTKKKQHNSLSRFGA